MNGSFNGYSAHEAKINAMSDGDVKDQKWEKLAELFRRYRMESGLSVEDLERRLEGVTSGQILAYETGEMPIPLDEIFSLTNALNIPPEEVMAILYDSFPKF